MKKIGELLEELGFKKDAPDSVKQAIIMSIIKRANLHGTVDFSDLRTKDELKAELPHTAPIVDLTERPGGRGGEASGLSSASKAEPKQLSFDFDYSATKNQAG